MLKQHLLLNPKTTDLTQLASHSAWALHVTSPLLGLQPCAAMPNFHIGATDLNLGPHVSSASAFISWAISVAKASFEKFEIKKVCAFASEDSSQFQIVLCLHLGKRSHVLFSTLHF